MYTTEEFARQVISDISANLSGVMTSIGNKLGLYKAMAFAGPLTSIELSQKLGLEERYVREWLNNQVAGKYLTYDKNNQSYELPDAHVPVLVDQESPVFLVPALEVAASLWHDEDMLIKVFQTGKGITWGTHNHKLFCGSEALFRPGYKSFLVNDWIAAMGGVKEQLEQGALVADIGCGHGAATIVMANAFPNSKFYGFDNHAESIKTALERVASEPAKSNTIFETIDANSYPTIGFDLISFMDCLHDMGDPVGAAKHALKALKPGASLLLVEPAAGNNVEDNINPISRLYYAASTAVCTPCSLSQNVGLALGAQAGPRQLSKVLEEAGFIDISKIAETPFNIIIQAKRP
jgi:SAM-dependent methyltransferase